MWEGKKRVLIFYFFKGVWIFLDVLQLLDDIELFKGQGGVTPGFDDRMGFTGKFSFVDFGIAVCQKADFEEGSGKLGENFKTAVKQELDVLLFAAIVVIGGVEGQ